MATIAEALALALQYHQSGALPQAEQLYRQILQVDPAQADSLHLLGVIAHQVGKYDLAVKHIRQAIGIHPAGAPFHCNLGLAYQALGRTEEALACYRQALVLQPNYPEVHNNLGNALKQQGRLAEAAAAYRQALRFRPTMVEAHNNLGLILQEQANLEEAAACYRQAVALNPNYVEALNNLGGVLQEQGQQREALACYRQALDRKPDYAEAHNNLGYALKQQGRLEEASACYRQAIHLKPDYAQPLTNLANVLLEQQQLVEAEAYYQQAIALKPDFAEAHHNRAMLWLLRGDLQKGWPEYEWRWRCKGASLPNFLQPRWDGSDLTGKTILLHTEQGLGDTIQFIRYAPLVKQRGGSVIVACPYALLRLLETCPGIDRLIGPDSPVPAFDVYASLLSLPGIFQTALDTIPAEIPYLSANPVLVESWRKELKPVRDFKVGIAWQGSPTYKGDRQRSIPLAPFARLAQIAGVRLFSLQKNYGSEQLAALADKTSIVDLGSRLDEVSGPFMDTAALMKNLDLVISPNTAVAHLAGALGVPTWVALPMSPDWRWLLDREDSPWYPHTRLFRQRTAGDWDDVFERIAAALQKQIGRNLE